jgi:hypothetical protein
MPTYRKLHTKIVDSYDFAEMPDDFTRVFWMLLIVTVDSEGRAIDNRRRNRYRYALRPRWGVSALTWARSRGKLISDGHESIRVWQDSVKIT